MTFEKLVCAVLAVMIIFVFVVLGCLIVNGPNADDVLKAVFAAHPGAEVHSLDSEKFIVRMPDGTLIHCTLKIRNVFNGAVTLRDVPLTFQKAPTP